MALCNSEFIICFIYSQGGFDEEIYMHTVVNEEQYTVHLHIIMVRILLLWDFNGQCNLRSLLYMSAFTASFICFLANNLHEASCCTISQI